MIKRAQLRQLLGEGHPLYLAALKVGMEREVSSKVPARQGLPSETLSPRSWRTREDPFQDVWPNFVTSWSSIPGFRPRPSSPIFQRRFPGRFPDIQLRTLQRKIKAWRATEGPPKEVFFDQITPARRVGCLGFHAHERSANYARRPAV